MNAVVAYADALNRNCLVLCEGDEVRALAQAVLLVEVSAVAGPVLLLVEMTRAGGPIVHMFSFHEAVLLVLRDRLRSAVAGAAWGA